MSNRTIPPKSPERYVILDVLRGIALLGICLANYPEFSLYTFQKQEVVEAMPTAAVDHVLRYFHYTFIEGKFYTLFSLLFGVGFSIILSKAGNGMAVFYRRMTVLLVIGLCHLLFLWAGDILILYAVLGMLLPLFRKLSDKKLLSCAIVLILFPIVADFLITLFGWNPAAPVIRATQYFHAQAGITGDNFPIWLAQAKSYTEVLQFNLAGSFIRIQEFIDGNRVFKVMGLFLVGLYIGRNGFHAHLNDHRASLKRIRTYGFFIGLPLSCLLAWSEVNHRPWGITVNSALYALSVVPLSFAYISSICLWYMKNKDWSVFKLLAAPGRMALTNYIGQSAVGIVLFYGVGFGLAVMGLAYTELMAAGVFAMMLCCSYAWMRRFRYGPLEWVWRMATYGKWLKIK